MIQPRRTARFKNVSRTLLLKPAIPRQIVVSANLLTLRMARSPQVRHPPSCVPGCWRMETLSGRSWFRMRWGCLAMARICPVISGTTLYAGVSPRPEGSWTPEPSGTRFEKRAAPGAFRKETHPTAGHRQRVFPIFSIQAGYGIERRWLQDHDRGV
jgi:hypothetical protein